MRISLFKKSKRFNKASKVPKTTARYLKQPESGKSSATRDFEKMKKSDESGYDNRR